MDFLETKPADRDASDYHPNHKEDLRPIPNLRQHLNISTEC